LRTILSSRKSSILAALCLTLLGFNAGRIAFANVVGPDMQNFNGTPDGLDFVTVQSSESLKAGVWNFGLFLNQASGTLPRFPKDGSERPSGDYQDSLLGMDLNLAVGVTNRLTLGLSVPQVLSQNVKDSSGVVRGGFVKAGTTEIRPLVKYQFSGGANGGLAAILSSGINMVEDNPYTGLGAPPIINFELALDRAFGLFAAGVNVGYRHRTPGATLAGAPVEPLGSQWIGSLAASALIPGMKSRLIGEFFGSSSVKPTTNRSDRMLSSAEGLLGIKFMASDAVAVHAGLSRELTHGIASPDLRVYAGINVTVGPARESKPKGVILRRVIPKKPSQPVPDYVPEESNDLIVTDSIPETLTPPLGEETFIVNNVLFAFDRDNLVTPGGRDILRRLAVYLYKAPVFRKLTIEGHTDFIGSLSYNQELSLRRATQIRRYLVEFLRVDGSRIDVVGCGEIRPIADNGNFQGRQMNRRVEFKITR
jgi:outer membrane protein OmpA-like peptidoglycan-associated protein